MLLDGLLGLLLNGRGELRMLGYMIRWCVLMESKLMERPLCNGFRNMLCYLVEIHKSRSICRLGNIVLRLWGSQLGQVRSCTISPRKEEILPSPFKRQRFNRRHSIHSTISPSPADEIRSNCTGRTISTVCRGSRMSMASFNEMSPHKVTTNFTIIE